ncbi:neuropeptide receptor 15-like [Haliotis asinina]|uniref:neuropeptide receptor 15-like n=1 Tax=Haliotis asinina TaxID=109174 RepID=UPI003532515A
MVHSNNTADTEEILLIRFESWNHTAHSNETTVPPLSDSTPPGLPMVAPSYIALFSTLFCVVGTVGILGNLMVVYIILADRKMRKSVTNMLILNLALADSLIMLCGIPEIVLFMINKGWLLGLVMCKFQRTVLVCALYTSVLTLVAVCIERYIAIVFPIKAHIVCTKRRIFVVIIIVWFFSLMCGTPTALFNSVHLVAPGKYFCYTHFPGNNSIEYLKAYKYTESALFYFGPLTIQLVCYIVIGKRLFVGVEKLHRNVNRNRNERGGGRTSEAIKARKGVVKMLIASVVIYFLSYSPHQVLMFYNTFSSQRFEESWVYVVFVTTLGYINSAANPLLYCVFSENFRKKFQYLLHCCGCCHEDYERQRTISMTSYTEYTTLFKKSTRRPNNLSSV